VALVIFYTLLLSISEYLSFNVSYLIAAVSIVLMLTLYARGVLQSWPLAFLVGGILAVLYGILFTIIQLQAYALLVGSIFIFCVLAIVMFISRKINWYNIRGDKEDSLDGNVQVKD
jgi:inner membrane protein